MGDILTYLNTGIYSLQSNEGTKESRAIGTQYQEEGEINSKNEISLNVTEARQESRDHKYQMTVKENISEQEGRFI